MANHQHPIAPIVLTVLVLAALAAVGLAFRTGIAEARPPTIVP